MKARYQPAFEKALEEMKGIVPYVVASKSDAPFDREKFRLSFFNRSFLIYHPEVKVAELDNESPPPQWLQLLLLHYLLTASGMPVADDWIAYRHLPGAYLFESKFTQRAVAPLVQTFGHDLEAFRRAGLALGGIPMSRTGDAAFRFLALPRIPMACILYLGDEEVAPSANILFDRAAPHYLPTEDLILLGGYLSDALCHHQP